MLGFDISMQYIVLSEQKQTKKCKSSDLRKKWYKIFTDAIDFVKANKNVDYVMVDINCQLKVFFKNGSNFFENISDLKNLIVEENTE